MKKQRRTSARENFKNREVRIKWASSQSGFCAEVAFEQGPGESVCEPGSSWGEKEQFQDPKRKAWVGLGKEERR